MSFNLVWTTEADSQFRKLQAVAAQAFSARRQKEKTKSSKVEGLFKQLLKCITLLKENPKHPGLQTHEYTSIEHPYESEQKVFEAYVQNNTPRAYRVFWCYGPKRGEITIITIMQHP